MKKVLLCAVFTTIALAACKKNEATKQKIDYNTLSISSNYNTTFVDDAGVSAVARWIPANLLAMLTEMDSYIHSGTTTMLSGTTLQDFYTNSNAPFTTAQLNGQEYSIATYTGKDMPADIKSYIAGLLSQLVAIDHTVGAAPGTAGLLVAGDKKYLLNAKGVELAEVIKNGLIGAMLCNQIRILTNSKSDNTINLPSKNYTGLANDWDMAFGYLSGNEVFPKKDPSDPSRFLEYYLGDYVRRVGYSEGIPQEIYLAFLRGRAAIVNQDMPMMNEQAFYINTHIELALASACVSYLNAAKATSDIGARVHALSRAYGLMYALRFAPNAKLPVAPNNSLLGQLLEPEDGMYGLTDTAIDVVRNELAMVLGIETDVVLYP